MTLITMVVMFHSDFYHIFNKTFISLGAGGVWPINEILLVTMTGCGGTLRGSAGVIQSPHYPEAYAVSQDCVWTVETSPGTRIELTIVDMEIEAHHACQYDYIRVSNGTSYELCIYNTLVCKGIFGMLV